MWLAWPVAAVVALAAFTWYRRHPRPFPSAWSAALDLRVRHWILVPDRFVAGLALRPSALVLEIGPGGGAVTAALLAHPAKPRLLCVDVQPAMLRKVRERFAASGSRTPLLACADGASLPIISESMDAVVLVTVLGEIPDRAAALRECVRVLRPGGLLAVAETLPDPDFQPWTVVVREARAAGFEVAGGPVATGTIVGAWAAYAQQFRRT